jgi:hypothetical protein
MLIIFVAAAALTVVGIVVVVLRWIKPGRTLKLSAEVLHMLKFHIEAAELPQVPGYACGGEPDTPLAPRGPAQLLPPEPDSRTRSGRRPSISGRPAWAQRGLVPEEPPELPQRRASWPPDDVPSAEPPPEPDHTVRRPAHRRRARVIPGITRARPP